MLTIEFVNSIYSQEKLDPRMVRAREMNKKLVRHVEGVESLVQEFLERINNYENEGQHLARQKHTISNTFVTSELLKPTDNVFTAKGGSANIKFSSDSENNEKDFLHILKHLPNGYSLGRYIEQVWFNKFITDPNGLIFTEVTDIDNEDNNIFPTYKNIHTIKSYKQNGIFVDWVIFEPHEKNEEDKKEIFWAVDEKNYYKYEFIKGNKENGVTLLKEITHDFEIVPAVICSDITDNYPVIGSIYKEEWKKSPIHEQIELLDKYLVNNSVLTIQEFQHNFIKRWEYADTCQKCNGTGYVNETSINSRDAVLGNNLTSCDCENGQYVRSDATDDIRLRPPEEGQQKLDPPSGYITMPTDGWELQVKSIDRYFDLIFRSQWQTTYEKQENATATGRFIDAQPVNNRLNKYSSTTETIHSALAFFIGKYKFPVTFEAVFIQYGRRYLVETPDQIWNKYLNAKQNKAPKTTLDLLLNQYYESEFRENEQMFIFESKKSRLEPFVHDDIQTIRPSQFINEIDKAKKEYFNEWVKIKSMNDIIEKDFDQLDDELTEFAGSKLTNNTQNEESKNL